MLIPDNDSASISIGIRTIWAKVALFFSIFIVLALFVIAFTYGSLLQTAIEYKDLQGNYQILLSEREKIRDIVHDLQKLKNYKSQITNTLAGYVNVKKLAMDTSAIESPIDAYSTQVKDDLGNAVFANAFFPTHAPLDGFISRKFELIGGDYDHFGIDIAATLDTPVRAAGRGVVIFSGWTKDFGNTVIVLHRNGFHTHYSHFAEIMVKNGDEVSPSTVIGTTGSTGQRSSGVHLHFEMWRDDVPLNPQKMILSFNNEE